jgi:hypothetical protein
MPHPLIWKDDLPEPELVLGRVVVLLFVIRSFLAAGATILIVATSESRHVCMHGGVELLSSNHARCLYVQTGSVGP